MGKGESWSLNRRGAEHTPLPTYKTPHLSIDTAVIASETREISRNSKRIWPYSSSRSSKVIDLGANGKPMCDFLILLVINIVTVAVFATVFEIFTLTDRKC